MEKMIRAAEVRAASYDESDGSVEVVWSTGAPVRRRDWRTGATFSEELEMTPKAVRLGRLNAGAPLLDTHSDYSLRSVIGSVVPGSARVENGVGLARVRLSQAPGDTDTTTKIRDGIIRNISVGYITHRMEVSEGDGDAIEVRRAVDWEPMEISAVPIPADPGAQIRNGTAEGAEDISAGARMHEKLELVPEDEVVEALRCAADWAHDPDIEDPLKRADRAYDEVWGNTRNTDFAYLTFGATLALALAEHR